MVRLVPAAATSCSCLREWFLRTDTPPQLPLCCRIREWPNLLWVEDAPPNCLVPSSGSTQSVQAADEYAYRGRGERCELAALAGNQKIADHTDLLTQELGKLLLVLHQPAGQERYAGCPFRPAEEAV